MSKDQKEYQKAQLAMLDWVDTCRVNGVGVDMVSIILLEKAVDMWLHFHGAEKLAEALQVFIREKQKEMEAKK